METQNMKSENYTAPEYAKVLNEFKCRTAGGSSTVIDHMVQQAEKQIQHMTGRKVTLVVQEKES